AGYALVMMYELAEPDPEFLGQELAATITRLTNLEGWQLGSATVLCVSTILLAIGVLRFELLPSKMHRAVLVETSQLGRITIDAASVCMLVERTVSALPLVRTIHTSLDIGDQGLIFHCEIIAEPDAVLTDLGPEVQALAARRVR